MSHLPPEFAALVIRGSEVNTFKEATKTPKTIIKGGNGKHTLT
jgi:hypothetical protein